MRLRPADLLLRAIVASSAVAYALAAPRWILGGDNGEFAALYAAGGIAHPPGYPTMVLWLRLWHGFLRHVLPADTPAHGAALATVAIGVLAVWMVERACLAWGAGKPATAVASAIYAFSPMAWKMSCHAEAFAMNAFFAAVILVLSAPAQRLRGARLTALLGLVAGAAVGNHQTVVLLLPLGLSAAARAARQAPRPALAAAAGVGALIAGVVLPYTYVYAVAITADPRTTPMWIEAPTLAGVLFHFRRGAYGTLSLTGTSAATQHLENLWLFARSCTLHTIGMPLVVAAAAARRTLAAPAARTTVERGRPIAARASWIALGSSFLLAGPLFVAWFDLPLVGAGPTVAERFYLLPEVLLTVMAARSLDELAPWLTAREGVTSAVAALAGTAAAFLTLPGLLEYRRPTVALYVENTLRAAPKDAILVGSGDHRWGGFLYARYALHARPDVLFVLPATLRQAWYRRDMQALSGVSFDTPAHGPVGPKTLMARLWSTGRPLFYTDWPDAGVAGWPHESVGTLMRPLHPGETPLPPEFLEAMNVEAFDSYTLEPTPPQDEHGWGYSLQPDYARPWGELGDAYGREGNEVKQEECYARAARLAPWVMRRYPAPP